MHFCGAKNLSLVWSVPNGLYPVVSFTGCDVFGLRLPTLRHDGLLMQQSPHVRVENLFNELAVDVTWLSDSVCVCAPFSLCLPLNIIVITLY